LLTCARFAHAPALLRCRMPMLSLSDCQLPGFDGAGIDVAFHLMLVGCEVAGAVTLTGARIGGDLTCSGSRIDGLGHDALTLNRTGIGGSVFLDRGFYAKGRVRLLGAQIKGPLNCEDGSFASQADPEAPVALDADVATITGGMDLARVQAVGEVRAVGANLGQVVCTGATFTAAGTDALTLDNCRIVGDLALDGGFAATGAVRLVNAVVEGAVTCSHATVGGRPDAFNATSARIATWLTLDQTCIQGGVHLLQTRAAGLIDDLGADEHRPLGSWTTAEPLDLTGFEYGRFLDSSSDTGQRFEWLKRTERFDPQAWRYLAEVYTALGRDSDARRTLIKGENERIRRGGLSRAGRGGRQVLRVTVGHGYRPWYAGLWAVAVIVAFTVFVCNHGADFVPEKAGVRGHPSPAWVYAADTFVPIIDLGEADKWQPIGDARWAEWATIVLGWALTTLFAAGFTSLVRT
jgi:hypothetical protein